MFKNDITQMKDVKKKIFFFVLIGFIFFKLPRYV